MSETREPRPLTPPEARRLWVEALRSGEYAQTTECLRDTRGYCCLGVLCDVFRKATGCGQWVPDTGEYSSRFELNGRRAGELPPDEVMEFVGLKEPTGTYRRNESVYELTEHNDDGDSFCFIADLIESHPPGLFVEEEGA